MNLLENNEYLNSIEYSLMNFKKLFSEFKNKTFVVTGATGLIGSTVIDFLLVANKNFDLNITVYALSRNLKKIQKRFESAFSDEVIKAIKYDANEPLTFDLSEDIDFIIHAASNASPNLYSEYPVETMKSNFIGMMNLLEFAKRRENVRMLYVSSSEIYGQIAGQQPLKEHDCGQIELLNPRSSYGISKRATETLCVSYYSEFAIETIIVRPGHIYGPSAKSDDNRVSSLFVRKALNQEDIVMKSDGKQLRSYTYSLDCALAILFSLMYGTPGEAYNISNSNSIISIKEMAEIIAQIVGQQVKFDIATPKETARFNPMINASLDSEKLEKLGWKGLFTAEQGFRNTIDILK